ncbi:hypothetical protein FACS189418_3970 [Clostridia bacterium]|nr:hypothetical protein FACS189418_3970 [Clostridia bacterium]
MEQKWKTGISYLLYFMSWIIVVILGSWILSKSISFFSKQKISEFFQKSSYFVQNQIEEKLKEEILILNYKKTIHQTEKSKMNQKIMMQTLFSYPVFSFLQENIFHSKEQFEDPSYERYLTEKQVKSAYAYLFNKQVNNKVAEHELMNPGEEMDSVNTDDLALAPITYSLAKLQDFDFLLSHFYTVHASTTVDGNLLNIDKLLSKDLKLTGNANAPQILIYHTHAQEEYSDYEQGNQGATVVGIGSYLTELLEEKGYSVIHDTTVYDYVNGNLDRNKAYSYALTGISKILKEHPSIEVVIDLHRDGVRPDLHLVQEIEGKQTAKIMLFNGLSQGVSAPISNLENPYREDNLSFSLQLQLQAEKNYPGLMRKIYLKSLRYNQHVRARSLLVEVGAQTNSYEEARNAMVPFANLLSQILYTN